MEPAALATMLRLALFFAAALAVLAWTGYGPAAFLLPARLRPYGLLLLAPIGYCWFALLSSVLNSTLLPMTWATPVILALATAANIAAWRTRQPRFSVTRETALVFALSVIPFVIGVLPLVRAGSTAFLGQQWDLEVYLPITEYLKRYAIGGSLDALPNPLTKLLNAPDFRGGSGWGFSYVEAGIGTLLGWPSFLTFRPLLHLLMTLSTPCIYVLARMGLGVNQRTAAVVAALWSVHGLGIWLASIGLAGHAASYFLLPLALLLSFLVLEEPDPKAIVLAGSAVAGLLLSFYTGALPFYALPVATYGLVLLARRPDRRRTVFSGLALASSALALAPVAHLRFLATLGVYFGKGLTQGWGITEFSPIAEALGLSPFILIQHTTALGAILGDPWYDWFLGAGWDLTRAAGLLALAGLWLGPLHRQRFLAMVLPSLALALVLRFGMHYAYGYFKALSILAPFLLVPVAAGAVALWDLAGRWRSARLLRFPARALLAGGTLAFVGVMLFTTHLSVRYFWQSSPDELPHTVWQLQEMKKLLPVGAPVQVLSRSGFNPRTAGMVAYFLMDNPLDGSLQTAYNQMTPREPGRRFEYIVLLDGVQPPEAGLESDAALWRNDLAALYRVPETWQAAVYLEGSDRTVKVSAQTGAADLRLRPNGWSLASGDAATVEQGWWRDAAQVQPELTLLSVTGGRFSFTTPARARDIILEPGLHTYRLPPAENPSHIRIAAVGSEASLTVLAARMLTPQDGGGALVSVQGIAAFEVSAATGEGLAVNLNYASPDPRGGDVVASLEVYQHAPNGTYKPFASWELAHAGRDRSGRSQFRLDPATWTCEGGREDSQAPPSLRAGGPPPDGQYSAHLALYHMGDDVARWPWVEFAVRDGTMTITWEADLPPVSIAYLPAPRGVMALRSLIPEGAAVLVAPDPDPDRSFIVAAAGFLEGRRVFADAPLPRRGVTLAEPAWIYDYALLPVDADPGDYGYEPAGLRWSNRFARLYERTAASPVALHRFPNGLDLKAGQELRLVLAPGGSRLDLPDGSSVWGRAPVSGGVDVEFIVLEPTRRAAGDDVLVPPAGGMARSTAVPPMAGGVVVHRQAGLALAGSAVFRSDGDMPVTVAAVRGASAAGQPGGQYRRDGVTGLRASAVSAAGSADSGQVRLSIDLVNHAGSPAAASVAGVDIYSRGQCRLTHFGYWALPAPTGAPALHFTLDPATKQGIYADASGRALALDQQTWPSGDGLYRGVVFARGGDSTYTLPAFQFRLVAGRVAEIAPLAAGRLYLLRPPTP